MSTRRVPLPPQAGRRTTGRTTMGKKSVRRSRPEWDGTRNDLGQYRLSEREMRERKEKFVSKHAQEAREELRNRAIRQLDDGTYDEERDREEQEDSVAIRDLVEVLDALQLAIEQKKAANHHEEEEEEEEQDQDQEQGDNEEGPRDALEGRLDESPRRRAVAQHVSPGGTTCRVGAQVPEGGLRVVDAQEELRRFEERTRRNTRGAQQQVVQAKGAVAAPRVEVVKVVRRDEAEGWSSPISRALRRGADEGGKSAEERLEESERRRVAAEEMAARLQSELSDVRSQLQAAQISREELFAQLQTLRDESVREVARLREDLAAFVRSRQGQDSPKKSVRFDLVPESGDRA